MDLTLPAMHRLATPPDARRSFRLLRPRAQLRLAAYVLAVSFGFGLLFALNSWAAFARIFDATFGITAPVLMEEIGAQAWSYLSVTLALLVGYTITVVAVTISYLHRLLGPTIAMERHVRALEHGEFESRVTLRDDDEHYAELAERLNRLATRLEAEARP